MEYFLTSVVLFRAWMFWTPLKFVKKLKLSSKYFLLCSIEKRKSYEFETEGWVNWHNSFFLEYYPFKHQLDLFHVMHTCLHVLLWIWQTFGRVQIKIMICILHVCLFPNRRFMLQFCTGRRLQIFLGFSHERCDCETLCVCTDCVWMLFQSVLWGPQGYRVMWWAKETGWHSERIFTLLCKCWWGERSSSHWCEAQRSRQTKSTHTNKPL